jgi:hypothetical protein
MRAALRGPEPDGLGNDSWVPRGLRQIVLNPSHIWLRMIFNIIVWRARRQMRPPCLTEIPENLETGP